MTWQNRIIDAGEVAPGELAANPKNWRVHPEAQAAALGDMLDTVGWVTGVIVNRRTGLIVDGHLRVSMALQRGEATIPVQYVDLAPAEEDIVLAAIDPISMLAGRNQQTLSELVNGLTLAPGPLESMLDRLVGEKAKPGKTDADALPSGIPPRTAPGDLWVLGPHRVLCGDSTKVADVKRLFGGTQPAVMLTDPPYCSGGFQEAGKRAGSVGTRGDIMVANDTLSTRGYLALMKGVIGAAGVDAVYVFTDWRMWVNLFDVTESSGFGVRNMIVWDKGTPGMGVGWRMQHELVLFGSRSSVKFDPHKAQGNVIGSQRTGNPLHPTQKPVDLLAKILAITDLAETVYDPFSGSGSTLIAAHQEKRRFFGMELEPHYVDVMVKRWEEYAGEEAVKAPAAAAAPSRMRVRKVSSV